MNKQWTILATAIGIFLVLSLLSSVRAGDTVGSTSRQEVLKDDVKPISSRYRSIALIVQDLCGVSKSSRYVCHMGDLHAAYGYTPPRIRKTASLGRLRRIKTLTQARGTKTLDEAISDIERNLMASWWIDPWHLNQQLMTEDHIGGSAGELSRPSKRLTQPAEESIAQSTHLQKDKHKSTTLASFRALTKDDGARFERYGENAFSHQGLRWLEKLSQRGDCTPEVETMLIRMACEIVDADRALAQVKIREAALSGGGWEQLKEARNLMGKAAKYTKHGEYDRATHNYRSAWLHAVRAEEKGSLGAPGHLQVGSIADRTMAFALGKPYPNPSGTGSVITYSTAQECRVSLKIYDVSGRLVRSLVHARMPPGYHTSEWDSRNDRSDYVGSGIYFCHMVARSFTATRKIVVLR